MFWQCGILLDDFRTALTVLYFCTCCPTWFRNCSGSVVFFYMIIELLWQCGIFLHDFGSALTVWYFSTWFLNCSDSVVFFYMISELFWQCGILRYDFWTVPTVCYFSTWFLNCSDSVYFYMISEQFWQCSISYIVSEQFWQCCVFLHDFVTALTVLYFSTCFSTRFQNCSDSVVFFYMCLYKARKANCHVFVC